MTGSVFAGRKINGLLLAGHSRIGDRGKMANGKLNFGFKAAVRAVMLWLCLAAPAAFAGAFEDGVTAHQQKDYATALRHWRPMAEQGNANAQAMLGEMYHYGQGVQKDYAQALAWYRKAANLGHAEAQASVGFFYHYGDGVQKDYVQALAWYHKAADQGNAWAQYQLGHMYENGDGVPQDYAQALTWYRKAADQGDADAQYHLGSMYEDGWRGLLPQDYVQAHLWYNLSAFRTSFESYREKAAMARDIVATKMSPAQIAEAQRLAREWKPK